MVGGMQVKLQTKKIREGGCRVVAVATPITSKICGDGEIP